jgi:hypothetical protein
MSYLKEQGIFIGFDDANGRIFQMVGNPTGLDQVFRVNVRHVLFLF